MQIGSKAIEQLKDYATFGDDCDWVLARDQYNEDGQVRPRRVMRRFVNEALVLELRIEGRVIGTTSEHPFFVRGKGWAKAGELRPGDEVRLEAPGWKRVEAVVHTGRVEEVYNVEVEGDHTYFVGCDEWGFGVWAHNTCNGLHHYVPVFIGSKVPRGDAILTPFLQIGHTTVHRAMNRFLAPLGMRPGAWYSGQVIRQSFSKSERLTALVDFYRSYQGGAHYQAFLTEMRYTLRNGLFK